MNLHLIQEIEQQNPWLRSKSPLTPISISNYRHRLQFETLMLPEWDRLWTILIGPRRAGKTTLDNYVCQKLIEQK